MLRNQPGIHSVKVALLAERGVVEFDPDLWTPEKIVSVSQIHATACVGQGLVPMTILPGNL